MFGVNILQNVSNCDVSLTFNFASSMMVQSILWHICKLFFCNYHLFSLVNKYLCGRVVDLWKFIVRLVLVLSFQFFVRTLLTIYRNEDPMRQGNHILDLRHQCLMCIQTKTNGYGLVFVQWWHFKFSTEIRLNIFFF